ncbi:hypothetical protein AC579_9758 [Pseudocercospora musae]|uniref:Uncharacterized protein n=1 Tax=Pseudocercospora musae TaxID=113226 RepID=A0A139IG18_9PEZI|nr:hypothetical protein AC579_9758 [Pseudocercospora musae]
MHNVAGARRAAVQTARLLRSRFLPTPALHSTSSTATPATDCSESAISPGGPRRHRDGRVYQSNPERFAGRALESSREARNNDLIHRLVNGSKLETGKTNGCGEQSASKTASGARQPFSKHAGKVLPSTSGDLEADATNGVKRSTKTNVSTMRGQYSIMSHIYEPFPKPINVTTFLQTKIFASDQFYPRNIEIRRRLEDFHPNSFIWVVRCPVSVSKKSTYRHLVEKKVRRAFRAALKNKGYSENGNMLEEGRSEEHSNAHERAESRGRLSGALLITLSKDGHKTLTAKGKEIRSNVELLLSKVLAQRETALSSGKPPCKEHGRFREQPSSSQNHSRQRNGGRSFDVR